MGMALCISITSRCEEFSALASHIVRTTLCSTHNFKSFLPMQTSCALEELSQSIFLTSVKMQHIFFWAQEANPHVFKGIILNEVPRHRPIRLHALPFL